MINFLSNWAEQLIVAIIIATIIEMLLPDNKNKKYIKMIIGIYILFNIVSPFIKQDSLFDIEDLDFTHYTTETSTNIVNQESMDKRLQNLYIEELEKNVKEKVEEQGYKVNSCKVDAILNDEKTGGINFLEIKISKDSSNIQKIDEIKIQIKTNKNDESEVSEENQINGKITKEEIEKIKDLLSDYYKISKNKINIKT